MVQAKNYDELQVGIAEYKVTVGPNRLITLGLGSCVGVSLYDPVMKLGGLLHIMLPDSTQFKDVSKPAKFADLGIPLMISDLKRRGGNVLRFQCKLVGGAQMFSGMDKKIILNIGERNYKAARQILNDLKIRILAEELGGNRGRTMIFDTDTGEVFIRTLGGVNRVI